MKVVVGVGNAFRSDDAVGLEVARLVRDAAPDARVVECEGEPVALLDALEGAELAIVVDATQSGVDPGSVIRFIAGEGDLPDLGGASTHVLGLADALELGRALGRLPATTIVYGIEGGSFAAGDRLSPEVERAAREVAAAVLRDLEGA